MSSPPLILASRSPRRAALLRDAGYTFTQATPPYDDPPQPHIHGRDDALALATELATRKAQSLLDQPTRSICESAVILGSDTICIGVDGELIGTPQTRHQAEQIIRSFIQTDHDVVTGIALVSPAWQAPHALADLATVSFGPISDAQLNDYLDTDAWRDKAGGYNLTDRQHAGWPITVQGDPTTVVGLPMQTLIPRLAECGIHPATRAVTR